MADEEVYDIDIKSSQQEKKIRIDGEVYIIREMMGSERDAHLTSQAKRVKVENGAEKISEFRGIMSDLIGRCLFKADGETKVPLSEITAKWSATAQKTVYFACRKINGLDDESKEAAKND